MSRLTKIELGSVNDESLVISAPEGPLAASSPASLHSNQGERHTWLHTVNVIDRMLLSK